ncbi:MAG: helix-turn-helix domain-containing protein [Actinomycetota bacterium]
MNAESIADLQRRAAKHAALSDPTRLAIVDMLSFGDQTPSELQHVLGLPSNLVAHHLKVLEAEGMVVRTRSEADQRRNYVHLVPATLDGIHVGRPRAVSRVVFVCSANSARSQLAAALWSRASSIPTASAGTHPAARIASGAIDTADRHGMALTTARPRQLDDVLQADDFIITVCDNAHEELDSVGDLHWSVPDPVKSGSVDAFDTAFDELSRRVAALAPHLTPLDPIGKRQ